MHEVLISVFRKELGSVDLSVEVLNRHAACLCIPLDKTEFLSSKVVKCIQN